MLKSPVRTLAAERIAHWVLAYERFVGINEVKTAQSRVIEAEELFIAVQQSRREKQLSLSSIHARLKSLNAELEKIPRTDDRYLKLLTEEHIVIKQEKQLSDEIELLEMKERDQFSILSSAVRDSHEKERNQSEKTKYWSLAGSCIGAAIGILGTTINNQRKMKQFKEIVQTSHSNPVLISKLDTVTDSLSQITNKLSYSENSSGLNNNTNNNDFDHLSAKTLFDDMSNRMDILEIKVTKVVIAGFASLGCAMILYSIFKM